MAVRPTRPFNHANKPSNHHFSASVAGVQARVAPGQWTAPTYSVHEYEVSYAVLPGTQMRLGVRHFDPQTHLQIGRDDIELVPRVVGGSNTIVRAAGTYMSVQNTGNQPMDLDKDFGT